jgi:hypothetical protein
MTVKSRVLAFLRLFQREGTAAFRIADEEHFSIATVILPSGNLLFLPLGNIFRRI